MNASFSFEVDRARDLVRIVMTGLFLPASVARFLAARAEAHARLACGPNRHLTLNDVRAMKVQPQETVAAFHLVLADPAFRSRRLAFVAGPTLARSQLMRALAGRDSRCFTDAQAAEAWLFAGEEDAAEAWLLAAEEDAAEAGGHAAGGTGSRHWTDAGTLSA